MEPPWSAAFLSPTRPALTSACHPHRSWRSDSRSKSDVCSNSSQTPPWPGIPKTSSEHVTLIAHYYRAEMGRMSGWRDRIDRTTNWAITVAGAMLSVSLSTPTAHHGVLLFAMILVLFLLVIESRRYRFFDVYRARVRLLERQYFAPLFAPAADANPGWMRGLSDDLRRPVFLM